MKKLNIDLNMDTIPVDDYWETVEALKDLNRWYARTASAVRAANKQLLQFDEINRLIAPPDEKVYTYRGRSSGSSTTTTTKPRPSTKYASTHESSAPPAVPFPFTMAIQDIFFNWGDLNWEQLMIKLVAELSTLTGGLIGFMVGGVPGALIGLTAGLVFGILMDSTIFNFDGKLSADEIRKSILAALPSLLFGIAGFIAAGPLGAALGVTFGLFLSFAAVGIDWSEILTSLAAWFTDLVRNFDDRWASFTSLVSEKWNGLKRWWSGLSLGSFQFRLPHLYVEWEELSSNSIISRVLGIDAIPHLGVQWYARGGIVNGPTLIGAGEQGREAVIPLERHTEWIRMVALELREQLESLMPKPALLALSVPVPPAALQKPAYEPDFSGLAETITSAIAQLGEQEREEPVIRVYLDGRQLSDTVTRYQRRSSRSNGG